MLQLDSEIALPEKLLIGIPAEIFNLVKDNYIGLHYIVIKKFITRNQYKHLFKILVQEKPGHSNRPEESVDEICRHIYLCLQYMLEEEDSPGKYFIQIYRNTDKGPKIQSKHVNIGNDSSGEPDSTMFDPNKVEEDLVGNLFTHNGILMDQVEKLLAFMSQVITPIIDLNKELQRNNTEMGQNLVQMRKLELDAEFIREEQKYNAHIEEVKIKANKEKWDQGLKQLSKSGALEKLTSILTTKLMGGTIPQQQPEQPNPQPQKEEPEEEMSDEEAKANLDIALKQRPLLTHIQILASGISQNSKLIDMLEDELPTTFYNNLMRLLNSQSEEDARANLKKLKEEQEEGDMPKLMPVFSELTENQQRIVMAILKFEV